MLYLCHYASTPRPIAFVSAVIKSLIKSFYGVQCNFSTYRCFAIKWLVAYNFFSLYSTSPNFWSASNIIQYIFPVLSSFKILKAYSVLCHKVFQTSSFVKLCKISWQIYTLKTFIANNKLQRNQILHTLPFKVIIIYFFYALLISYNFHDAILKYKHVIA